MADSIQWITVGGRHIPLNNVGKFNPTSVNKKSGSKEKSNKELSDKDYKSLKKDYSITLRSTSRGNEFLRMQNKSSKEINFVYNTDKKIQFSNKSYHIETTGKQLIAKVKEGE